MKICLRLKGRSGLASHGRWMQRAPFRCQHARHAILGDGGDGEDAIRTTVLRDSWITVVHRFVNSAGAGGCLQVGAKVQRSRQISFVRVLVLEDDVTSGLASKGVHRHSKHFRSCLVVVAWTPESEEMCQVGIHILWQRSGVGRRETRHLQHGAKSGHDVMTPFKNM